MHRTMRFGLLAAVAAVIGLAGQTQAPAPPKAKSQAEGQALQAMAQAPNAKQREAAAEEFLTKYADSEFKPIVLLVVAQSAEEQGNGEKAIIYGERVLEANPDPATKAQALILLAKQNAQRTREFDLDRDEKLEKVSKYGKSAIDTLNTMAKPNAQMTDDQWNTMKSDLLSDAHEALGMGAAVKKDYATAESEFKEAVALGKTGLPTPAVRLADVYNRENKYDDAIALCDKVLAMPNLHPGIKSMAENQRAKALKAKESAAKPATPAAPAAPAPAPAPAPAKP